MWFRSSVSALCDAADINLLKQALKARARSLRSAAVPKHEPEAS